jgi:predicted nuclease of predicted toxin-antitoxin system
MIIWVDAQLSPAIAPWLAGNFSLSSGALRDLGLRDATDREIFAAAKSAAAVVMTKDSDFVKLLEEFGPPPQVLWLTCGNTSNARLRQILSKALPQAIILLESGEPLVEIR